MLPRRRLGIPVCQEIKDTLYIDLSQLHRALHPLHDSSLGRAPHVDNEWQVESRAGMLRVLSKPAQSYALCKSSKAWAPSHTTNNSVIGTRHSIGRLEIKISVNKSGVLRNHVHNSQLSKRKT
jgi:hypothetical protein